MGLPAPPPMESTAADSTSASQSARPLPDWQKDPHGWIDYDTAPTNANGKERTKKARVFCTLQNLNNRAELNGQVALCVGYYPSVRRYQVQLCRPPATGTTTSILSVSPDKVRRASPWQYVTGKLYLLLASHEQIRRDARAWVRRAVPVGLLAGHAGPTDAQVDEALGWIFGGGVVLLLLLFVASVYVAGFAKASLGTSWILTVAVVVGPEVADMMRPGAKSNVSIRSQRCLARWTDFVQDTTGQRPSPYVALASGVLWCAHVGWVCWGGAVPDMSTETS